MPKKEYFSGIVRDNDDPEKRGRLVIECPEIVHGQTLSGWVEPIFHYVDSERQAGAFWVPNIDAVVTVEIESEEDSEVTSLDPKWRCDVYPAESVPDVFQENYPNRRGWVTPAGHILYFDDTDDQMTFLLRHPSGAEIAINNDGQIAIKPPTGQSVLIGDGADQPIPLGTLLQTLLGNMKTIFDVHTHNYAGGGGTTDAPNNTFPVVDDTILSDDHKVK